MCNDKCDEAYGRTIWQRHKTSSGQQLARQGPQSKNHKDTNSGNNQGGGRGPQALAEIPHVDAFISSSL